MMKVCRSGSRCCVSGLGLILIMMLLACGGACGGTLYVWQESPSPSSPYGDWNNAAHSLQDAVDVAVAGDTILVTNGTYLLVSELSITNSIIMASVNGPSVTVIDGQGVCRCVNMSNTASTLSGFTVTHGYTETNGAGIHCADHTPVITNCVIVGNQAYRAGGAYYGTLYDCILGANTSTWAGGAYYSVLVDCELVGNIVTDAFASGGGVHSGNLRNCCLISNRVDGAYSTGGGAADSVLENCLLYGNIASGSYNSGGGTSQGALSNCTLSCNSAYVGGGASRGFMYNCIAWGNTAETDGADFYIFDGEAWYTCASDISTASNGCINADPLFVDAANGDFSIRADSPCFNTGNNAYAPTNTPYDLAGNPRIMVNTVDMGAFEVRPIYVDVNGPADGDGASWATAFTNIQSGVDTAEPGDFIWVTNGTYLLASEISMTNSILMTSVNGPVVTVIDGQGICRGVNMSNTASTLGGFTVTHGYTETNGAGIHCVDHAPVITNCIIVGNQAYRAGGVYYGTLYDCILSGNTSTWAGGAFYSVLTDCELVGNSVTGDFASGGGVHSGTLKNCRLVSNRVNGVYSTGAGAADSTLKNCLLYNNIASGSYNAGGGTSQGTLNNCTVYSNSAQFGGGASRGILRNCIIWNNSASQDGNDIYDASVWYSCASDVSTASNGCIDADPLFADPVNGDYQLQAGSPCMDTGTNMTEVADDIVGVPRPLDGNNDGTALTDMGAYEYVNALADSDGDWLPDTNEMANGTSPILADSDGDQMIDGAEIEAGTDPLNSDSFLGMFQGNAPTGTGVVVEWSSVEGKMYNLRRSTNLVESSSVMVMTNIVAIPPLNVVTDTTASVDGPLFYWVELAP